MKGESKQIAAVFFRLLILCLLSVNTLCFAELGTIHLKDGKSITVEIVAADRGQVIWRVDERAESQAQITLRSLIESVDFPPTDLWMQAEIAYESGKMEEAIKLYNQISVDPFVHYYAIPGNFASLAQVRLLDCYRIKMDQTAIVKQADKVQREFQNLPLKLRKIDPAIKGWIAISKKKWEEAITAIEGEDPPSPEGFLLKGMALESLGRKEEAVQAYAGAYILNFGGTVNVAKQALQRSAAILAESGNEDRKSEIQAQAKIYRDLFGKGKLWAGAPEWLIKLADGKIETLGKADASKMSASKPSGTTLVVAEKLETVSLPDPDKRPWVLVSELPQKIYLRGVESKEENFKEVGGVIEKEGAFVFDGTGGGIHLSGIDSDKNALSFRLVFITDSTDGAIFDLNNVEGAKGGFGVYLKKGELHVTWTKGGEAAKSWSVGKVKTGQNYQFELNASESKTINYRLGTGKFSTGEKPAGALGIGVGLTACIGDTKAGTWDRETADGAEHTPFKGKIVHLSIGTADSGKEIESIESKQFGGKEVLVIPPK